MMTKSRLRGMVAIAGSGRRGGEGRPRRDHAGSGGSNMRMKRLFDKTEALLAPPGCNPAYGMPATIGTRSTRLVSVTSSTVRYNSRSVTVRANAVRLARMGGQRIEELAVQSVELERFRVVDAFTRELPREQCGILVGIDHNAARQLAGLVQALRVGRADVDPHPERSGEIAHRERGLTGFGEPVPRR